jgi:pheromone shutdown protein TraB
MLAQTKWLSIPRVYAKSAGMLRSLVPLLLVSCFPLLVEAVVFADSMLTDMWSTPTDPLTADAVLTASTSALTSTVTAAAAIVLEHGLGVSHGAAIEGAAGAVQGVPWDLVEGSVEGVVDMLSVLVLVRLSKLIGADRDIIIARKTQQASRKFPGKDIVVVIGMLHLNGVAMWLMSGEAPEQPSVRRGRETGRR